MKYVSTLTGMFLLLFAGSTVFSQDEYVERDVLELVVYSGLGVPVGGISDWRTGAELNNVQDRGAELGWDIGIDIGYFVTPKFILGANFVYTEFSIDTEDETSHNHRLFNPNLYAKYTFEGESYFVPYVKGHVGLENPKFSTFVANPDRNRFREVSYEPSVAFGIGAGLFYYTADYSGIFIEVNYHTALSDETEATYRDRDYSFGENVSVIDLHAGIRLLFGTGE